jgi:VanZ family protein
VSARRAALVAALFAAFVVYGSLYPFAFRPPPPGAWEAALARGPGGRGDILANLALYAPLGLFLAWAIPGGRWRAALAAVALATALSVALEAAQLFDRGRVSSRWDVAMNAAGALAGALAAPLLARLPGRGAGMEPDRFAALLLLAWFGSRLFPYVPSLDWQAWKDALKPLLLWPEWDGPRTLRLALAWLLAARLAHAALPRAWLVPAVLLAVGIGGEVVIRARSLSLAEALAVPLGLALWWLLRGWERLLAGLAVALVLLLRLEPFAFADAARSFGWVPFRGLIAGSWQAGLQAALEKLFLTGGLLWSLSRAGLAPAPATLAAFALVLATSVAQTWLPGRSAEIGDALLVLLVALVWRGLVSPPRTPRPAPGVAGAGRNPPPARAP